MAEDYDEYDMPEEHVKWFTDRGWKPRDASNGATFAPDFTKITPAGIMHSVYWDGHRAYDSGKPAYQFESTVPSKNGKGGYRNIQSDKNLVFETDDPAEIERKARENEHAWMTGERGDAARMNPGLLHFMKPGEQDYDNRYLVRPVDEGPVPASAKLGPFVEPKEKLHPYWRGGPEGRSGLHRLNAVDSGRSDWDWDEAPPGRGHPQDRPWLPDPVRKTADPKPKERENVERWHSLGQMKDAKGRPYDVRWGQGDMGSYFGQAIDPDVDHAGMNRDDDHEAVIKWNPYDGEIAWRGAKSSHRGGYLSMFLKDHLMRNLPPHVEKPQHSTNLTQAGAGSLQRYYEEYGDPHGDIEPALRNNDYGYGGGWDDEDEDDDTGDMSHTDMQRLRNHGFTEDDEGGWSKEFNEPVAPHNVIEQHYISPDARLTVHTRGLDGRMIENSDAGNRYGDLVGALETSRHGFAERNLPSFGWTPHYKEPALNSWGTGTSTPYPPYETPGRETRQDNPYKWTKTTHVEGDAPYHSKITMPPVGAGFSEGPAFRLDTSREGKNDNLYDEDGDLSGNLLHQESRWTQGIHNGGRRDLRLTHPEFHQAVQEHFGRPATLARGVSPNGNPQESTSEDHSGRFGVVDGGWLAPKDPESHDPSQNTTPIVQYNWDTGQYEGHTPFGSYYMPGRQMTLPLHTAAVVDEYSVHPDEVGYLKARDFYDEPLNTRPWEHSSEAEDFDARVREIMESAQHEGIREPVDVAFGRMHDGAHRWEAARRLGIDLPIRRHGAANPELAVKVRYFGHAERQGTVGDRAMCHTAAVEEGDTQHGLGHGHTAPTAESGVPFHDPENYLPGVYDHPEYYVQPRDRRDPLVHASGMENWRAVKAARGNPEHMVQIYRAVPHGVTRIEGNTNPAGASWVSASPSYAKRHAEAESCPSCGGDMQVISGLARAGDLHNEGYLEEWGYTGDPIKDESALTECPEGAYEARKAAEAEFMKRQGAAEWWEERKPAIVLPEYAGEPTIDYYPDDEEDEDPGWQRIVDPDHVKKGNPSGDEFMALKGMEDTGPSLAPPNPVDRRPCENCWFHAGDRGSWPAEHFEQTGHKPMVAPRYVAKMAAIPDESGLKAAGIAVIAMDTGRVLMQQRALNPIMCPCGQGVTWDEQNGYQHDDGSVSHDNDEFYGQSVSDLLDQGHPEEEDEENSNGDVGDGLDESGFDKTAALEFDPNEGTWEFPGGKLDPGESARAAAIREFREEVGQDLPPGVFVGAWVSPGGISVAAAVGWVDPEYRKEFHDYLDHEVGYSPEDFAALLPEEQRRLADGFGHYIGEEHPLDARYHLDLGGAGHQKVRMGRPGTTVRVLRVEKPNGEGPFAYGGSTIPRPFEGNDDDPDLYSLLNPYEEDDPDRGKVKQRQPYADGIPARYIRGRSFGFLPQHNVGAYFTPKMLQGLHERGFGMSEYDVPGESLVLGRTQVAWRPEDATLVSHTPLNEHPSRGLTAQADYQSHPHPEDLDWLNNHGKYMGWEQDQGFGDSNFWARRMPNGISHFMIWRPLEGKWSGDVVDPEGWSMLQKDPLFDSARAAHHGLNIAQTTGISEWQKQNHREQGTPESFQGYHPERTIENLHTPFSLREDSFQRLNAVGDWRDVGDEEQRRVEQEMRLRYPTRRYYTPNSYPVGVVTWTDSDFPITKSDSNNGLDQPMVGFRDNRIPDDVGDSTKGWSFDTSSPACATCYDKENWIVHERHHNGAMHPFTPLLPEPGERRFAAYDGDDGPPAEHQKELEQLGWKRDDPEGWSWHVNDKQTGTRHSADWDSGNWHLTSTAPDGWRLPDQYHQMSPQAARDTEDAFRYQESEHDTPGEMNTKAKSNSAGYANLGEGTIRSLEPRISPSMGINNDIVPYAVPAEHDPMHRLNAADGPFYHGTVYPHAPGDVIDPANSRNYFSDEFGEDAPWGTPVQRVFFTRDPDAAARYGEHPGGLFRVEPTGPYSDHPWEKGTLVSAHPLRVVEQIEPKLGKTAKAPVYKGFIYLIQREADIDLGNREIANPDDPDGDMSEQSAWWEIGHAKKNPALRPEVKKGTPWAELELWADKSVRNNKEIKEAVVKLADSSKPMQKLYQLAREQIAAARPRYSVRKPKDIAQAHHDMIVGNISPTYYEEKNADEDTPKIYALKRGAGHATFLAPLVHNQTGQTGWVRGGTNQDPSQWRMYRDDEIDDAVLGRVPARLVKDRSERVRVPGSPRGVAKDRTKRYGPAAEKRYDRPWARGNPVPGDALETGKALGLEAPWKEGDVPLDEEGHQQVEPQRDRWLEPEGTYWTDLNWDDPGDSPLVKTRRPEDDKEPWWKMPDESWTPKHQASRAL